MNFDQFASSLSANTPPPGITPYLEALWYDAKNDWDEAHTIVQDIEDPAAAWIHAYLHRKEGDISNARYWYVRASRPVPAVSPQQEWEQIVKALL